MAEELPSYSPNNPSFSSNAIHFGNEGDRWKNGDVVPPICVATTYVQELPPHHKGFQYARLENPTRNSLQDCLAKLENTKYCLVLPSGMAAVSLATRLLRKGDHVVAQKDLYHGILKLFKKMNSDDEFEVTFVDGEITKSFETAVQKRTKLVWLETPTNPLMKMTDLKAVISVIKSISPSAIIVCDNTFLTPYFQRPANFGVDIVMHSCSKYIGGHSDILMGALCTNNEEIFKKLKTAQIFYGPIPSSFDCYLALRSLKTLELRMEKHMTNSLKVARFLEKHPMIDKVFHPGLPSHPQHQLSLKQCYGHSGIFSFYINEHNFKITKKFLENLRFIRLADSLGGTETTLKVPCCMPPDSLTLEEMEDQGITEGLVRISVGLENAQDLISDLEQALVV